MDKGKKKKIVRLGTAAAAFTALLSVCVYTVWIRPAWMNRETVLYIEEQVQTGDLIQGIVENGSVEWEESSVAYELDISYEEEDEEDEEEASRYLEIEEVYVVQGQRIEEGDALLKFTQSSINAVLRNLKREVSEARAEASEAGNEYDTQARTAKSTYSATLAEADTARRTLNAQVNGLQQEIDLLYGEIQVMQEEINDWNKKLVDEDTLEEYGDLKYEMEKAQKLLEETDTAVVEAYVANYEECQAAVSAFEELDELLQSYRDGIRENTEEIQKANERILEAQTALEQEKMLAQQEYDSAVLSGNLAGDVYGYTLDSLKETVSETEQALADAQELLADFEAFVGTDGVIRAEGNGIVTELFYEAGDQLETTGTLLSYAEPGSCSITIDVSEEDISHISVGDTVTIEMNAYPEESWTGTVSAVTTSADEEYSTTVNYPVTIHVEGDTDRLYGGMTADITFVTDSVENVLYVSAAAIVEGEDGSTGVYVEDGEGNKVLQPVTTGFSNGRQTQILEGLSQGDTIYTAGTVSAGMDADSLKETDTGEKSSENGGTKSLPETQGPAGMENPFGTEGLGRQENRNGDQAE